MSYRLSKIIMHNFKLFTHAEIDFERKDLVVLDGPNGYGKTSTFDAIEYVITGTIRRVTENSNSSGNIGFSEDCLMKVPSDGSGTYVKGLFCDENGTKLIITRTLLKGENKKLNNPKQIKARTRTKIELHGELLEKDCEVDAANNRIEEIFGNHVISSYNQFYYISQEDRLAFLSKSDAERMREIKKLFGTEEEEELLQRLKKLKKKFKDLKDLLETDENTKISEKKEIDLPKTDGTHQIEYQNLLIGNTSNVMWNQEEPQILDREKLSEMQNAVREVGFFTRDFKDFWQERKNAWLRECKNKAEYLKRMLLLETYVPELDQLKEELNNHDTITKMIEGTLEEDPDYEKIAYQDLAEKLEIEVDLSKIQSLLEEINTSRKGAKKEDSIRSELTKLQNGLERARNKWLEQGLDDIEDNRCPFCGHGWESKEELEKGIQALKEVIENHKGASQKKLDEDLDKLKNLFLEHYQKPVQAFVERYRYLKDDVYQYIYHNWEHSKLEFKEFHDKCTEYEIDMSQWKLVKEDLGQWDHILKVGIAPYLQSQIAETTDEYQERALKYRYDIIFRDIYEEDKGKVKPLEQNVIDRKISYLEKQFYFSQGKRMERLTEEINTYRQRKEKVSNIIGTVESVEGMLDRKLKNYRRKMVRQLELPFYFYTGRILQNYPGGLGIKMTISGDDKIRFEATARKEHDVLYTLSSGQLSAVAIALALTLNKVYAQEKFRCVMIDDPIQTMDELNVSSFVEVLRNDFNDYQFILSTHEEDFSDYIRHKYQKYNLSNKPVTIQNVEQN